MLSLFVSEKEFTVCMCTHKYSEIFVTRGRSQFLFPCAVSMYPLPRFELLLDFGIDWSWTINIPLFHRHTQGTGLLQVLCILRRSIRCSYTSNALESDQIFHVDMSTSSMILMLSYFLLCSFVSISTLFFEILSSAKFNTFATLNVKSRKKSST